MTTDLVGKKLKIPGKKLFSMWEIGIEWMLGGIFIFLAELYFRRMWRTLGYWGYVIAAVAFLGGIYLLARALYWTFATVEVNETGISIFSLRKQNFIYWSDVEGLDFKDVQQYLILKSRSGGLALYVGFSDFNDLLAYILENVRSNRLEVISSDLFRHNLSEREIVFSGFVVWLVSMYVIVFIDRNKLYAVILGAIFFFLVYEWIKTGKRYIEVKNGRVRNVQRRGGWEVQLDQITDVNLFADESEKSESKSLVLRIQQRNGDSLFTDIRGPQLLPLYLKLRTMAEKEKGGNFFSHSER